MRNHLPAFPRSENASKKLLRTQYTPPTPDPISTRRDAQWLQGLAEHCHPTIRMTLLKEANRIQSCRSMAIVHACHNGVMTLVGYARCKSSFCTHCQRAEASKRYAHLRAFCQANLSPLAKFHLYHLTLTLPHSAEQQLRTGVYTDEILKHFADVRGTEGGRRQKAWWEAHIVGGTYFVQNPAGRTDNTAHIHIHALLIARDDLQQPAEDSFESKLRSNWMDLTGSNEKGVYLERLYWQKHKGGTKHYCHPKKGRKPTWRAINAAVSYISKGTTPLSMRSLTTEAVCTMLIKRQRTYGRFGALSANSRKQSPFTKLELLAMDSQLPDAKASLGHLDNEYPERFAVPIKRLGPALAGPGPTRYAVTPELLTEAHKLKERPASSKRQRARHPIRSQFSPRWFLGAAANWLFQAAASALQPRAHYSNSARFGSKAGFVTPRQSPPHGNTKARKPTARL
jgi:hypothetical protein